MIYGRRARITCKKFQRELTEVSIKLMEENSRSFNSTFEDIKEDREVLLEKCFSTIENLQDQLKKKDQQISRLLNELESK